MAVLGLDALASASYGPEALLTVLLPLGSAGPRYASSLTLLIVGVLLLLYLSYRQTISAYPEGGGAYTVTRENIGTNTSLLAAAALAVDYLLNVAVAISAGVGALVSMVPSLRSYTLLLCLVILVFLALLNLRGVRTTGLAFLLPAYAFVICLVIVIVVGSLVVLTHGTPSSAGAAHRATAPAGPSVWLLARAFANGCTAMTGIEAVSNGVPMFREPRTRAAKRTLGLINLCLAMLLLGIAWLCRSYGISATVPGSSGYESVLSRVVSAVVGRGAFYHVTLSAVVIVLALSANTSFADFPRVCWMVARDQFLPEAFTDRGRRLAFSTGIVVLSACAALLLVVFDGVTDALIPLFAVGAFLAFSMSQIGMVAHWRKQRHTAGATRSLWLNAIGAAATLMTLGVVMASKFVEGAWITVLLVAALVVLFRAIRTHYDFIATATLHDAPLELCPAKPPIAVVPVRRWDAVTMKALSFAMGFAPKMIAVQVLTDEGKVEDLTHRFRELVETPASKYGGCVPELVVLRSEFRKLFEPLLAFVRKLEEEHPDRQVAVIVPELVERRWYQVVLHRNTASMLKALLVFRGGPQIVIVSAPWHLADWLPERRWLFNLLERGSDRRV